MTIASGGGVTYNVEYYILAQVSRFVDASVSETSMAWGSRNVVPGAEETGDMMREYWARLPADRFPNLTAVADVTFAADTDTLFEFGLDLLVRGLAAHEASR